MSINSIGWMTWLYIYLGIGVVIALIFYGLSLKDRPSKFVRDMRSALGYGKTLKDHLQDILVYTLAGLTILIGWPGFLIWAFLKKLEEKRERMKEDEPKFMCRPEYLVRKVTLIEAEQANIIEDPLGLIPNLPFGHFSQAWTKFLSEFGLEDENELWYFEVPKGSSTGEYDMFDGPISGYAKIVKGKVTCEFVIEGS
jgi:hypothetical protein